MAKVIVGLGNPGVIFAESPHNIGFRTVDSLVPELYKSGSTVTIKNQHHYWWAEYKYKGERVIVIKPLSYMNLSGAALRLALKENNLLDLAKTDNILVIHDELDIEPGSIKVVANGGPGNNNGCKNIDEVLCLEGKWSRIKVGAKPVKEITDKTAYVIGKMSDEQKKLVLQGENKARAAALKWLSEGIVSTMTEFNQKGPKDGKSEDSKET